MGEGQNLEEAGTGRFGSVDAIRERRGLLGGRLGRGRFAEQAVGERPGRQGRRIVAEGESGDDVLGRIGLRVGAGQEVERRYGHAAIKINTQIIALEMTLLPQCSQRCCSFSRAFPRCL